MACHMPHVTKQKGKVHYCLLACCWPAKIFDCSMQILQVQPASLLATTRLNAKTKQQNIFICAVLATKSKINIGITHNIIASTCSTSTQIIIDVVTLA